MANSVASLPLRSTGTDDSDRPPFQDPSALATISPSRKPPKARIDSPAQAQSIVQYAIEANRERARKDAMVKGMFDGNAPFNAFRLKSRGEGWRANFNTLEAKARAAAAKVPYYDLFSGAKTYLEFETDFGSENDRTEWSAIVTEETDRTLKEWEAFDFSVATLIDDYVKAGKGFLMWQDESSWPFRRISQTRLLVPDGTSCEVDEDLEYFIVRQKFTAPQLWKYIRDPQRAREMGWDVEAVVAAIRDATPNEDNEPWDDPVTIQQRLKDADLYVTARSSTVNTARLYVREFDGRVSELMVLEYGYSGRREAQPAFLYKRIGRYDSFRQVLAPFFFDMEDGSWHGASALGKDIFAACQTKDRVRMAEIDATFMRLSLLLQARSPSAMQKAALQVIGNAIVIPHDVQVQSSQVLGDITTAVEVNRDLDDMLDSNTGIYRPRIEKPAGNPEPATATQLRFGQANVLTSSYVNRFLRQLDRAYEELFRRLTKPQYGDDPAATAARDFQKRCEARGVPKEVFSNVRFVRASRTIGNGSWVARQQALQTIAGIATMLPETGRTAWLDDTIAATLDTSKVARYNPKPDSMQVPNDQQDLAMLENSALRLGHPVAWSPTQNNMIHAQIHLQAGAQAAASLEKGAKMDDVYSFLESMGPHVAQHLKALSIDPTRKGALKVLMQQWQDLSALADKLGGKLRENAQKQQQVQQVQSGMDPDLQLKAAEMQAKMGMAEQKAQHQMGLRERQATQKMELADAMTAAEIRRKQVSSFDPNAAAE